MKSSIFNVLFLVVIASCSSRDTVLLDEPAKIHFRTSSGDTTAIEGSVILTKSDCILKFRNEITVQQNLTIDKLTIPVRSMKDVTISNEGKSFEYILGETRYRVDSDSSLKIVDRIKSLQK